MKKAKVVALMVGMSILSNAVLTDGGTVFASCNFYSTLAQNYMKSEAATETVDGVLWSFCLNTPTTSSGVANITDLKATKITGSDTQIAVPSAINGVTVTELGVNAFESVKGSVTAVTLPSSITRICDSAFKGCTSLKTVTFENPDNISVLGQEAFMGCTSLTEITLGKELMKSDTTGDYAFKNCSSLEKVVINNKEDIFIPQGTFETCKKLSEVVLNANAASFQAEKNSFLNCAIKELTLPNAIINENAFEGNKKLKNLVFTKNAEVKTNAFKGCFEQESSVAAKTVEFNGSIVKIGENTFESCAGITNMNFSTANTMVSLAKNCINGTSSLKELDFKGKDISLSDNSLKGTALEKLSFNNTGISALYGDLFGTDNSTLEKAEFNSPNVSFYQIDSTGRNVFGHAKAMSHMKFTKNVQKFDGTIAAKGYYKAMYFFNPYVVIGLADKSEQAYTVYGYDMSNEVSTDVYYGVQKFAQKQGNISFEHIQIGFDVQYVGSSDLYLGQDIATTYIKVAQSYADGSKEDVVNYATDGDKYKGYVISHEPFVTGANTVYVTYGDKTSSFSINVLPIAVKSFKVTYVGGTKKENDTLLLKDFKVTDVEYNNGTKVDSITDFTISDYGVPLTPGKHIVKVTYGDHTEECEVVVEGKALSKLNVVLSATGKEKKYVGERLTKDDFIVTAVYDNGDVIENFQDYELSNNVLVAASNLIKLKAGTVETTFTCQANTVSYLRGYYDGTVTAGGEIDNSKLIITAIFSDGAEKQVTGYTINNYSLKGDGKDSIVVVYEGKSVTVDIKGTNDTTGTVTPTIISKPTVTLKPTATPKLTATPKPKATPKPTVTLKPTATPKLTATPKPKATPMKLKCSLKGVTLKSKGAKVNYKHYTKKTIKFVPSYKGGTVQYQVVKKGEKLKNSNWKKAGKKVSVSKEMRACVYFRYKANGKYKVVKSDGFVIDKTSPVVTVGTDSLKLKVVDKLSGVSSIKVNGKKVKNGYVLSKGDNKIVVTDKAGNKKKVICRIE